MDGTAIAASKSCELNHSASTEEVASATSSTAREYIAGRTDWQLTASWLVGTNAALKTNVLRVGSTFNLRIGEAGGTATEVLTGSAILTECRVDAAWGSLIKGSFKFKGTGPLT